MKLGAGLAVLVLFFAVVSAHGISPPADLFLDQHAGAIAKNIYDAFTVRFADGRRTFHAREPIEIELLYERPAQFTAQPADGPEALSLTRAQFDRAVAAPLRVVDSKFDDHVAGGVSGCLTYAPIVVRRTLTHLYRFDTPGRYRMFLQSRQVTPEFETSNILEFEILPRDAAWEEDVLKRAESALTESPPDKRAVAHAFHTLRTLATNDATALLARHYQSGTEDVATADVEYGLFANPDRAFVVDALLRELVKPERTFGWRFMPTLARLELARRHPDGPPFSHDEYLAVIRQFAGTRARALNRIPGRLSREMRNELMKYPSDQDYFVRGAVTPAVRDFPQEAMAAFRSLSPEAQRSRLLGSWRRFADPVFLPLLRSLYESPTKGSNEVRDIALRRLFQLAPEEGRRAMRAELRRGRLRVSMETLSMLPDHTSPEEDAAEQRLDVSQALLHQRIDSPNASVFLSAPRPRIGDESRLDFFIEGYAGRSLVDLDRTLRQFPPGTRIYWADHPYDGRDSLDRWTWAERDELFERVRADAARYGVIVQREPSPRPDPAPLQFGPRADLKSASASGLMHSGQQGCR